jgi:hypothetical protein
VLRNLSSDVTLVILASFGCFSFLVRPFSA